MLVDLNSGSGFVYGALSAVCDAGVRINALIDAALEAQHRSKPARDYLGGSRIGEPCARRLAYEVTLTPADGGEQLDGRRLRIFDAGHALEDLTIRWLQAAGFDLRTRGRDGRQFGFSVAGGHLRGHIDGVIVTGPDVGIVWPTLFEHKALKQSAWIDLVKHGLRHSKPVYFAQCQLYMAYMELEVALFTAMNKDAELSRAKEVIEDRWVMRVKPHGSTDVGNGVRRSPAGGHCRAHVGVAERVAGIDRDCLLQLGERLVGLEVDQRDDRGDLM
jgi:hypothetical protein